MAIGAASIAKASAVEVCCLFALAYTPTILDFKVFFALFFIQYATFKFYDAFIYPFALSPLRSLPGPKGGHFLLGQTYNQITAKSPTTMISSWTSQFPKADLIRYLTAGNAEFVLISSRKALQEIMQIDCYTLLKPSVLFRTARDMTGVSSLFFIEDKEDAKQRKVLAGPFLPVNVKNMMPVFSQKAEELCSILGNSLGGEQSCVMEVSSLISKMTLDIIGLTTFGYEPNSLSKGSEFADCYKDTFPTSLTDRLVSHLNTCFPARRWLPLKANRKFLHANRAIDQLLAKHIKQRDQATKLQQTAGKPTTNTDLLGLLIRDSHEKNEPLTEDQLVSQLRAFMIAGHESSAKNLISSLHLLSTYPDIQERLRKEINAAAPTSKAPTYEEIQGMLYLDCFVKETLRHCPPSVSSMCKTTEDVSICGHKLPSGTTLVIYPAALNFNSSIWGPSVDEFDPNRWISPPDAAEDPYVFHTLLNGSRVCVEKEFSMLEVKLILIHLVRQYTFHQEEALFNNIPSSELSLEPLNPLKVRISQVV